MPIIYCHFLSNCNPQILKQPIDWKIRFQPFMMSGICLEFVKNMITFSSIHSLTLNLLVCRFFCDSRFICLTRFFEANHNALEKVSVLKFSGWLFCKFLMDFYLWVFSSFIRHFFISTHPHFNNHQAT